MTYARQRLGLPLVCLWAIAHGMWMGASWHAGTEHLSNLSSDCRQVCNCAATNSHSPVISQASQNVSRVCPVCQLGAVAPDVPVVALLTSFAEMAPQVHTITLEDTPRATLIALPPGRGPPSA